MNTIASLAKSRLRYNKSRTLLTATAIMLTTILLSGLGSSVIGLMDMERQQAVMLSNVHATFSNLTGAQVEILKKHADVEAVRTNEIFATVEYEKMNGFLTYSKDIKSGIYQGIGVLIDGHLAETADEICGPAAFFEQMDTEAVIGNTITIPFRPNGKGRIETREFTICGIISERDVANYDISNSRLAYGALISEDLLNEYIPSEERNYSAQIRVYGETDLSYDKINKKIEKVAEDIGCDANNINFNSQYLYTMTDPDAEMSSIAIGIALLIILFSGVVIFSIYYVSVITDVQEIGRLKVLGASRKQIKRLILSEGICISTIAIPIGLIIGYAIPYFILPVVMNAAAETSITGMQIEKLHLFSLPMFVCTAAVVLLTVYVSLLKPMRMAARISPVEAIRYQESSRHDKLRNGNLSMNIFRLSAANLIQNKRRTIVTMLTMGLSCVLFMSLAGVMNSMSAEDIARRNIKMGDFRLELNAEWNDKEYPENNLDSLQERNIFSEEFLNRIQNINGVENIVRDKAVLVGSDAPFELFEDGNRCDLSYLTRESSVKIKKELKRGEMDYDKLLQENGAVFSSDNFMDEYGFGIGDTIPLTIYDGSRRIELNIKIAASMDSIDTSHFLIPEEIYDSLGLHIDSTTDLYISVDKNKYQTVKSALQAISDSDEYFQLYSMDEELKIGGMFVNMIQYTMCAILVMIAIISFMNLTNTMIISIVTRKRELGVLQAIGLSNKQLIKMLAGEGMFFTMGALIISVTIGNLCGYLVFLWTKKKDMMSISAYHYPLSETIFLAAALLLVQLLITYFISKHVHKESLIDRMRSGE